MANFDRLTDTDFWERAAYVLAGYMGAGLLDSKVDSEIDMDVPNETYGVVIVAGGAFMGGSMGQYFSLGGGLHTGEHLVDRLRGE